MSYLFGSFIPHIFSKVKKLFINNNVNNKQKNINNLMIVKVGFSDMPSPFGILHNVTEVEQKGEKNIINIFFNSQNDAAEQFYSHEGFKAHMSNRIELVSTLNNKHFIRIYNKHDIDIITINNTQNE